MSTVLSTLDGSASFECQAMPDSGTSRTIINSDLLLQAGIDFDRVKRVPIRACNSTSLACAGTATLNLTFEDSTIEIEALVADNLFESCLVSFNDLVRLGVLPHDFPRRYFDPEVSASAFATDETTTSGTSSSTTVPDSAETEEGFVQAALDELLDKYPDVFDDTTLTPVTGEPMKISIDRSDKDYRPIRVKTSRKVPLHFQKEAEKTLQWYLDSGVLEKVPENTSTEWCSPGFFVPKPNGKVRLVVDYREINRFIRRPVHPFPSPRDIVKDIRPDSKWFLKLDATQGYYQIPLDEDSKDLTTFLLPSGRYRFTRAPMGLSPSSDNFCDKTDFFLKPVPDILKIVDDALLQAPSFPSLLAKLKIALDCCRKHNLTLSRSKLQLGTEIEFAGYLLGSGGVKPDPKRVAAISDFPRPLDVTGVRSFIGLCNQLGFFIPDLTHVLSPLRELLKKNVAFVWTPEQENGFIQAKRILTSDLLVRPFDPMLKTELLTDAARLGGLGYALIQRHSDGSLRLIQCGSRALSSPETRYATNELEMLAVHYAVKDCHFYLYGAHFTVVTDHKPLLGTFAKDLSEVENARLQRIREKLVGYTFNIVWVPGKIHLIADALSRAPVFRPVQEEVICANYVLVCAVAEDPLLQPLYDAAAADQEYQDIISAFKTGKPLSVLPPLHPARALRSYWDDISLFDNALIIFQDHRIFVPAALRKHFLEELHVSHSGISKTKALARQHFFWPGLSKEIELQVGNCEACRLHRPSLAEVKQEYAEAEYPMQAVSVDLFDNAGADWIVMVDRFSNYIWTKRLTSTTTASVTNVLHSWFLDYGFPSTLISDNGPQFRSDFGDFCAKHSIKHTTSSPYNPRSNGLAEGAVKAAKSLLKKSDSALSYREALFALRNTPLAGTDISPAQLFHGRVQRHSLPSVSFKALPSAPQEGVTRLKPFQVGDHVTIQNLLTGKWDDTGVILEVLPTGQTYMVRRQNGKEIKRNRRFLDYPFSAEPTDSVEDESTPLLRRSERVKKPIVRFQA